MYKIAQMNGDVNSVENEQLLKDIGKILYNIEDMNGTHDRLLSSFIPKRYIA